MSKDLFFQMREQEVLSLDKATIINKAKEVKDKIIDGDLDALQVLIMAKKLQELGKQLEEQSRPIAEDKTRLQRNEVFKSQNVEIIEKVIGAKTDYASCNDPYWSEINQQMEELKIKLKLLEEFLSAIKEPTTIVTSDGEIVTINPPVKSGRLGLALTLK